MAGAAISAAAWQLLPRQSPSPAPAKVAAPVAPATVAAVPRGHVAPDAALRELAGLWGESFEAGDSCRSAPAHGLRCFQGRGGLYELRQLDRPAVLTLRDGVRTTHAVLVAMDDDTVTLSVDGAWQRVRVAALAARFDGSFTTFWKAPSQFREQVPAGDSGADVDWIAAQLGVSAGAGAQTFDAAMQKRLRAFQSANGLKADGMAGPRTWIRLNQLGGVAEPRLLARSPTN
jgi:general secretion pathway protein A